jgi:hypothetical protein
MESMILGVGGVVVIVGVLALLSRLNTCQQRRILQDVTRPRVAPVNRYDLQGDLLPPEQTSLGPVDYRRIADVQSAGYILTTQQARHAPTLETSFIVPALTAVGTAICVTIGAGALAWAFGWPAKTVLIVFALSLVGGWFWRLGWADRVLWQVENWTGKDLDHDHQVGRPAVGFAVANPGQARATAARSERVTAEDARRAELLAFLDRCYLTGCAESAHGVMASGPDRARYVACRDVLMSLGLARWKNPERPKGGWVLTSDPATAKAIVSQHVL